MGKPDFQLRSGARPLLCLGGVFDGSVAHEYRGAVYFNRVFGAGVLLLDPGAKRVTVAGSALR